MAVMPFGDCTSAGALTRLGSSRVLLDVVDRLTSSQPLEAFNPALELAWKITLRGGSTVTAGLPHPDKRFALPPVQLVAEERTLRGSYSYIGSAVPARDIPRYIDMYRRGRLPVDRLMGEQFTLDDINRGLDRLATGQAMRDVVLF